MRSSWNITARVYTSWFIYSPLTLKFLNLLQRLRDHKTHTQLFGDILCDCQNYIFAAPFLLGVKHYDLRFEVPLLLKLAAAFDASAQINLRVSLCRCFCVSFGILYSILDNFPPRQVFSSFSANLSPICTIPHINQAEFRHFCRFALFFWALTYSFSSCARFTCQNVNGDIFKFKSA